MRLRYGLLGTFLLGSIIGAGFVTAGADEASAIKIAPGTYAASGQAPDGKTYSGDVAIEPLGKVLAVLWRFGTAGGYKGVGLAAGSVFGVAYGTDDSFGLVIYRVKGGQLDGRWSLAADKNHAVGREVLQGPPSLNGDYQIVEGDNPTGGHYTGHVIIGSNGKTYALKWYTPNAAEAGTGILIDDMLVVAYGPKTTIGVVAYQQAGDHLHGTWAGAFAKDVGTEDLTPKP